MTEASKPVERLAELSEDTRQFLSELSADDLKTLRTGLPIIRAILGFGLVTKWIAVTLLGILAGIVLFGESTAKILGWIKGQ